MNCIEISICAISFCTYLGGREFVFQTGPEHPWILDTYARSARYPFTSVVAQEVFQSGVIPSDTDFRVFVEYGELVGKNLDSFHYILL